MKKVRYTHVNLVENARRIIYTYGSVEECAKECNVDINSLRGIIQGSPIDTDILKALELLLKYPL